MSSSKLSGSVVVGGECSEGAGTVLFVVPDDGGEGEESLKDACGHAGGAAGGVSFKVELRFEGVVDRLDDLAEGAEEALVGSGWFGFERRSDQPRAVIGQGRVEFGRAVTLVGDDGLSAEVGEKLAVGFEQVAGHDARRLWGWSGRRRWAARRGWR